MDVNDYPLLHVPDLTLALLRAAAARRREATVADAVALLRLNLRTAREDPPVSDAAIAERLRPIRGRLTAVGLLEPAGHGGERFRLTELGRRVLDENPDGVDDSVLARYVEPERLLAARRGERRAGRAGATSGFGEGAAPPRQREYDEGAGAYREGRDISANPYPLQTAQHQAWEAGWSEARDEDTGVPPVGG